MKQMIDEHGNTYHEEDWREFLPVILFVVAILGLATYGLYSLVY